MHSFLRCREKRDRDSERERDRDRERRDRDRKRVREAHEHVVDLRARPGCRELRAVRFTVSSAKEALDAPETPMEAPRRSRRARLFVLLEGGTQPDDAKVFDRGKHTHTHSLAS